MKHSKTTRVIMVVGCLILLSAVYLGQRINYAAWVGGASWGLSTQFAFNRTWRLVVNDGLCMGLVWGFFANKNYLRLAFYLFLLELLVLLPLYFWLKLSLEGPSEISSPLLSPVHRMIVNPLLMFILIGAFFYQQFKQRRDQEV